MTLDLLLGIVSAVATLTIGIAASVLAYQQFRISKAKLRFDLYEKRLALFKLAREYTQAVVPEPRLKEPTTQEIGNMRDAFDQNTSERYFLFGPDVVSYFDELLESAQHVRSVREKLAEPCLSGTERINLQGELGALCIWFYRQPADMVDLFRRDLSIKGFR